MLVQVRMPLRLVESLDRMAGEGLYSNRSEAILDAVRRLALAYEKKDHFRRILIASYLGRQGTGTIESFGQGLDIPDIVSSIERAFGGHSPDQIIDEVRR